MAGSTHPHTLEVGPAPKPGTFGWAIRTHGTLAQRSDRTFRTEAEARRDGEKAIERLLERRDGDR